MGANRVLDRVSALLGAVLLWLPLLAPVVFSLVASSARGFWRFDYLMPAELFPAALVGGALLLLVSLRLRRRRALVGWGFGSMIGLLVASQGVAVLTGLASGAAKAEGWRLALVVGLMAGYVVALLLLAIASVLLVRDAFSTDAAEG